MTQAFNTTTSMGRLTLNVLLSFAQFEREVTGERIRDKIAASKAKGMWMGGNVPLGYDPPGRTLSVNEREAASGPAHLPALSRTRLSPHASARTRSRGLQVQAAHHLVREGDWRRRPWPGPALPSALQPALPWPDLHRDQTYPGQPAGIVDADLFDQVQQLLAHKAEPRARRAKVGPEAASPRPRAGGPSHLRRRRQPP